MQQIPTQACPVPPEQQPINEYEALKDSWPFRWGGIDFSQYCRKLAWIAFWGGMLVSPIAAASFIPQKFPWQFLLSTVIGTCFVVTLVLTRLYLGWSYIFNRLVAENVVYEESGWYDGQTWCKPTEILNRDRLIATYQVNPILKRLQKTFFTLATTATTSAIIWLLLNQFSS